MADKIDAERALHVFYTWLSLREKNGLDWPYSSNKMAVNMSHSALLRRMLDGKDPLPEAPPKRWSYPWYELIESGRAEPKEVWECDENYAVIPLGEPSPAGARLIIDQHAWEIIERQGPNKWIVAYMTPDLPKLAQERASDPRSWVRHLRVHESRWLVHRDGEKWIIERHMPEAP